MSINIFKRSAIMSKYEFIPKPSRSIGSLLTLLSVPGILMSISAKRASLSWYLKVNLGGFNFLQMGKICAHCTLSLSGWISSMSIQHWLICYRVKRTGSIHCSRSGMSGFSMTSASFSNDPLRSGSITS